MLPIFRIVPVGGVFLAILILLLAITPPGGANPPLSPAIIAARGPLIDRDEHPEWRQLVIRAALRRADELNRLRELPDTPMRVAPAVAVPIDPPRETPSLPEPEMHTEPVTPASSEPAGTDSAAAENTALDDVPPAPLQTENITAEAPPPDHAQPTAQPATVESPALSPATIVEEAPRLVAALPVEPGSLDPAADDMTGSVDQSPSATIPIDIGETSSTELPVTLPDERQPAISTLPQAKPVQEVRRKRRVQRVKPAPQEQPSFFEILFGTATTPESQASAAQANATDKSKTAAPEPTVLRQFTADPI